MKLVKEVEDRKQELSASKTDLDALYEATLSLERMQIDADLETSQAKDTVESLQVLYEF